MRLFATVLVSACLVGLPAVGMAQGEEDETEEVESAEATDAETDGSEASTADASAGKADAALDTGDRFDIRHGLFATADLGVFLTFGGTNTNNPLLPKRGTSNIQPYLGVVIGYDVAHTPDFNLGVGLKLGMLLNGGAGRVSNNDIATVDPTSKPNDFNIMEAGLAVEATIMMTDRVALSIKGDGGLAITDPDPSKAAAAGPRTEDALGDAGGIGIGGIFGVGAGVEYFTLLNGFSVGLTLRFVGVLADGFIPGAAVTVPLKYNF